MNADVGMRYRSQPQFDDMVSVTGEMRRGHEEEGVSDIRAGVNGSGTIHREEDG